MEGKRISYKYSIAFKQKVVSEIESGKLDSVYEAQRLYDIRGNRTIYDWVRKLGKNELIGKVVRVEMKDEKDKIKALEQEKRQLEKALVQAHIKVVALESLIEVAEEHYGVDFKKNFTAKP
jgi:transposase-like protein